MQLNPEELHSRLEPLFQENFEKFGELGAAVSVWQNGKSIVDLHSGSATIQSEPGRGTTIKLTFPFS